MKNKSILYIGNALSKHGFTPTTIETLSKRLMPEYSVRIFSSQRSPVLRLFSMWLGVLRNRKAQLALIDTYSSGAFHFAWTSAALCRIMKIPYVAYIHGGKFQHRVEESPSLVSRYIAGSACVVAPSEFLLETVAGIPSKRSMVIPNTVDLSFYRFGDHSQMEGIRIFWLRSLQEIYRPMLALDILKNLLDQGYKDVKLVLVGPDKDGSLAKLQARIKKEGLEMHVELPGKLQREEWQKLASECNVFLNTTSVDNTPVSVIEAMALGLPVVSSNVGGMPYLIENGKDGILIESSDPSDFANAIARITSDKELYTRLANNARAKVENFDWKHVQILWDQLINECGNI